MRTLSKCHNKSLILRNDRMSSPVVDLEGEDPSEELEREPAKKQKMGTPSKEPTTPIRAVLVHSERGDFLQLSKVWSEPELCGPQSTLFLDDPELKIIQDLGPAGWSKAITDGVIATMKALEVVVALNNASLEGEIRVDALAHEKDALTAKVVALEEEARSKRSISEERDRQFAVMEKQLAKARIVLNQATDSSRKLAEEKVSLEEALKKADLLGEDEAEDTAVLMRADLMDRIGELEGSLVDAVKLGFDRAVAQLKVVNPDVDLSVEGTHPLSDVKDGVIIPPPDLEEDNGNVDDAQATVAL
jgi:hypothetical protein